MKKPTTRTRIRPKRLAALAVASVLLSSLVPTAAQAGHWNDLMRYLGWGWSDGYHACPRCGDVPAAYPGPMNETPSYPYPNTPYRSPLPEEIAYPR